MTTTKPQTNKLKSAVPGVYYREDGKPRWEVKIRWTDKEGKRQNLPTIRFPVNHKARPGDPGYWKRARADAEAFASSERQSLETFGRPQSMLGSAWSLGALLKRYLEDLEKGLINHKSLRTERSALRMLLGLGKGHNAAGFPELMEKNVSDLVYEDFVNEDNPKSLQCMLKGGDGKPAGTGSLKRVLTVVRGVFVRAQRAWGIELKNPLQVISGLPENDERDRIIKPEEWAAITSELAKHEAGTRDAIIFARFTAARRSEIVKLDWQDVDFINKTARLRETKSRTHKVVERTIPLPANALEIVMRRAQPKDGEAPLSKEELAELPLRGPVFLTNKNTRLRPDTITQAWSRACERAGLKNVRLHDLRHTRITELGRFLTAAEAARVSGHTDLATFFRYFNPDPKETGRKIDALERGPAENANHIKNAARALAELVNNDDFAAAITQAIELRTARAAGK